MKTYAAIYNNNEIRENSSSGGIFSALAGKFDVVYGVAMTDDCYGAEMIRVEGDISSLRGSKYFQAKVGDAFKQVKKDLLDGKKVINFPFQYLKIAQLHQLFHICLLNVQLLP